MAFTVVTTWDDIKSKIEYKLIYSECSDGIAVYSPIHDHTKLGLFEIVYYAFIRDATALADFRQYIAVNPEKGIK